MRASGRARAGAVALALLLAACGGGAADPPGAGATTTSGTAPDAPVTGAPVASPLCDDLRTSLTRSPDAAAAAARARAALGSGSGAPEQVLSALEDLAAAEVDGTADPALVRFVAVRCG